MTVAMNIQNVASLGKKKSEDKAARACKSVCVNSLPKTFQASDLETQS